MGRLLHPLTLNNPTARQLEVFAVDDDGAIKVSGKLDNRPWNPPHPLSATSFAQPGAPLSGVYYPPGGTLEVFHVGQGSMRVFWKASHVQDSWQGPQTVADNLPASEDAHSAAVHYPVGETLEVFVVGNDGGIYGLWKAPHVQHLWQLPFRLANATNLAPAGSPLTTVHYPVGETLEVFVVGNDGGIYGLWKAPHVQHLWQPPFPLANAINLAPRGASLSAVYYPPGETLELFFVDNWGALTLLWKHKNEGWQGPIRLSRNDFAPPGAPVTAVYYPSGETLEVHLVGLDGRLWVAWKDHNGPWTGLLHPLTNFDVLAPMTPLTSTFYPVNEQLEVFVGDVTWFVRVLWKHHNRSWAPCLAPLGPRSGVTYVPAAYTRRIAQVTGTYDFISAGVRGVDLGASANHRGTHYVFFGDVPQSGLNDCPAHDADAVAWVRDLSPNGISLEVVRSGQCFTPFTIRKPTGSLLVPLTGQTPTGAFSDDGFAYVFVLVADGDPWPVVSYLTRTEDPASGQPYDEVFRWSESKFWQVAPKVVDNSLVPGLPSKSGRGVVMLGGGVVEIGGDDAVHLAWMPLEPGRPPRVANICYYRGETGWSAPGDHASATPLWRLLPGYTSISMTFVSGAQRWLALYSNALVDAKARIYRPLGAVVARTAPTPMGPWSDETPVFDPCREGAFGTFMHWPDLDDLDQSDPSGLLGDTGWAYGAFILEPLTQWHSEDQTVTLHYLLSTSRPYQVQHMSSRFRLG
jgi:hypothetical protein